MWVDVSVIFAVAPFAFVAIRILFYSGGDFTLMRAITSNIDIAAAVLGTVLPVLPIGVFFAIDAVLWDRRPRPLTWTAIRRRPAIPILAALTVVWFFLVGPWPFAQLYLLALFVGAAAAALISRARRRSDRRRAGGEASQGSGENRRGTFLMVNLVGAAAMLIVLPAGLWLPEEEIGLRDGDRFQGYVLDMTQEWATLVDDTDAGPELRYIPTPDVQTRTACLFVGQTVLRFLLGAELPGDAADCSG